MNLKPALVAILASLALIATPALTATPVAATTGTDGLTCSTPVVGQTYIDGHGPYTTVRGGCSAGPADTTWRMRVRFETVFGGYYWKSYGWADYTATTGQVVSTRIGDEVFSIVYQWGDSVVPTSSTKVGHVLPPTGLVLSHVEGSNSTGWYVEATRYHIPIFATWPKFSVIKTQTCEGDAGCISLWRSFYAALTAFRDAEQPAPVVPLVLHHHSGPVTR